MDSPALPKKPYLKPWFRFVREEQAIHFQYGERVVSLHGRAAVKLVPALLPLLDGTRTLEDIHRVLGDTIRPATEQALAVLVRSGVVGDGGVIAEDEPEPFRSTARLHATFASAPAEPDVLNIVRSASVGVLGGGVASEEIARQLRLGGVGHVQYGGDEWPVEHGHGLIVAVPSPEQLDRLEDWNRGALAGSAPWLVVLPFDGQLATVGPLMIPRQTCCFECYRRRRAANLENADIQRRVEATPSPVPNPPALVAMVAGLTALLTIRWLSVKDHFFAGTYYAVVPGVPVSVSNHKVYRVPRCTACSRAAESAAPSPWHERLYAEHG